MTLDARWIPTVCDHCTAEFAYTVGDRPCPRCGSYQHATVERWRRQLRHPGLSIAATSLLLVGAIFWVFSSRHPLLEVLGVMLCLGGATFVRYRRQLVRRFDPNRDAHLRAGREHHALDGIISRARYDTLDAGQRPEISWRP
jgi:hypothetical protein